MEENKRTHEERRVQVDSKINSLFPSIPIRKDNKSVLGGAHYPQVCLLIVC